LQLDALAGERTEARRIGIAAPGVIGGDRIVVLLEIDDGHLELALGVPVGGRLLFGRAGRDADGSPVEVLGLLGAGLRAHHEGLAFVEIDALEIDPERRIAGECDGRVARQQVDLARLEHRPSLLHRGRRVFDLAGVAQHGGRDRAAVIDVDAAPLALSLAKEKPGSPRWTPHSTWPRALMASSV